MRDAGQAYRALAPAVLGYLRAQRAPDPEDVLGEVFLQVARDIGRFDGDDEALRRWVFSITHNRLIDARRRAARRPVTADADVPDRPGGRDPAAGGPDPGLVAALASLTPDQREVVVLRFVADLSVESTASVTGTTPGAVKALTHRALGKLQGLLAEAGAATEEISPEP